MLTDVVVPHGNEAELAAFAKNLDFRELILLYSSLNEKIELPKAGIALKKGVLIRNINDAPSAKARFDYVFAPAERQFFESKKVDFVVDAEKSELKDLFFQRRSGLDDAMCKLAKANGITIIFNASLSSDKTALGRMRQNARLCRKHKLSAFAASFARKKLEMRAQKDLEAFSRVLGLF